MLHLEPWNKFPLEVFFPDDSQIRHSLFLRDCKPIPPHTSVSTQQPLSSLQPLIKQKQTAGGHLGNDSDSDSDSDSEDLSDSLSLENPFARNEVMTHKSPTGVERMDGELLASDPLDDTIESWIEKNMEDTIYQTSERFSFFLYVLETVRPAAD